MLVFVERVDHNHSIPIYKLLECCHILSISYLQIHIMEDMDIVETELVIEQKRKRESLCTVRSYLEGKNVDYPRVSWHVSNKYFEITTYKVLNKRLGKKTKFFASGYPTKEDTILSRA
jgi:hypothetical protein